MDFSEGAVKSAGGWNKTVFLNLKYPEKLIDSTISRFSRSLAQVHDQAESAVVENPMHIILPFKAKIWLTLYAVT